MLAVAAGARLLVFALARSSPARFFTHDSFEYDRLAHHFQRAYAGPHHGQLFDLTLLRPPGYPAFIAAVNALGGGATAVVVVELVVSVLTVALTYVLAATLFDRSVATIAALLLAIDPVSVAMSSNLTSETLFAFFLVAAALAFARFDARWAAVSGFVVGISVLVRPISLYLPVVLALLALLARRRRGLTPAIALLVAAAIPIGAWMARNAVTTGVATVSTVQAVNLLDYRAAGALAIDDGISRLAAEQRLEAQVRPASNPARTAQRRSALAWHTLFHHPVGAAATELEGLGRVLFGPGRAELLRLVAGRTDSRTLGDRVLLAFEVAVLFALLALAAVGTFVLVRRRAWGVLAVPLVFAVYVVVLSAGAEGNARLRMPAAPFLAILAGVGFSSLAAWSAGRSASPSR